MIDKTIIKFIFVGIINTIVGAGVMFGLYNIFGVSYFISTVMNYVIGSIVSFLLNKYYTFSSKEFAIKEIFLFIGNIALCYSIAYGLSKPFIMYMLSSYSKKIQDNTAMFLGMCVFILLNYFMQRYVVFKKAEHE